MRSSSHSINQFGFTVCLVTVEYLLLHLKKKKKKFEPKKRIPSWRLIGYSPCEQSISAKVIKMLFNYRLLNVG